MRTQSKKHVERRKPSEVCKSVVHDSDPKTHTDSQEECSVEALTFEQLSPEFQQRLKSAARILATGAIRAASKQAQDSDQS
jgi:hypothetical protein